MKLILLSVLLLLAVSPLAVGQGNTKSAPVTKCTLTLAQAPQLRGLRLGANQAQVLSHFPGLSPDKADQLGLSRLRLNLIDAGIFLKGSPNRERAVQVDMAAGTDDGRSFTADSSRFPDLKGVRKIQLRFLDGRLSYVQVGYDDSFKWNSVDEFAQTVSKNLGLPDGWLQSSDSEGPGKGNELRCVGFLMTAVIGGDATDSRIGAQLSLEDAAMAQTIEKRQKDQEDKKKRAEEDRRKTFKP
jgi:hypothetical protein